MKPRILIFSLAYEPWIGGAELAVRYITDRLFNYEFDLITCQLKSGPPQQEKIGNVTVYRVGFGGRLGKYLYPFFASRFAGKLHRRNPYVVAWSIMAAYAGGAAMLFLRKHKDVKFLLTLQEGDSIEHIHGRVRYFRSQWRRVFSRADYIQVISNFLADWARQEGARCPVEVVPNGVDLDKFKNENSKKKDPNQKFRIVSASRLVYKNGVDILIRAGAELKTIIPDSKFVIQILGAGPLEKELKELADELGVRESVEFMGHVRTPELPKLLSAADVFVRPSRSEGLGSAFLEAMAAGLPVVATPVGGIPDFLRDGETGLFAKVDDPVDLAEKIKEILDDPDLKRRLVANAGEMVRQRYDWNLVAGSMDKIFKHLVRNKE